MDGTKMVKAGRREADPRVDVGQLTGSLEFRTRLARMIDAEASRIAARLGIPKQRALNEMMQRAVRKPPRP